MRGLRYKCILIVAFFLAACHSPQREARKMVCRAEQLADTFPDSTASLIDSVLRMPVYFNERQRMDMALLQAKALFGDHGQEISPLMDDDFFDDKPFLSTSPDLERAAAYYSSKKQYTKAAHAALYSGFVQQHYNDKTAAMQSFKDAERYGGMVGDNLTVAQAEYRMGKMLIDDSMIQEALAMLNKANIYFGNSFVDVALVQNMMGVCNMLLGDFHNSEICLQQSLLDAKKGYSNKVIQKALNNYAVLYRLQKNYGQAIVCLRQIARESLDDTKMLRLNMNFGDVYNETNAMDSAAIYYRQVDSLLPKASVKKETKVAAYTSLSRFAESQGNTLLALQYWKQYNYWLNEVRDTREQKNIYAIQQKYDYESLQNTMNQRLARTQRIIALGIVLLLGVVAMFLHHSLQRNKREAEINANLFHFMQQNEELKRRHEEYSDMDLDKSQKMSDLLSDKFRTMQKLDYYMQNQGDKSTLRELERELFGGKNHLEAIMELFDTIYPDLQAAFKAKYPQATDLECKVYLLSRFRLPRVEEATLLGISTSVLDKVRGKVRKMMENG